MISAVYRGEQRGIGPNQRGPLLTQRRAGRVTAVPHPAVGDPDRGRALGCRELHLLRVHAVPVGVQRGERGRHRGRGLQRLNQIESWFGIITGQSIRRGTFSSVKTLITQIRDYTTHWNAHPRPFIWTASADEILAKVRFVQSNIKKLVDNNGK